MLSDFDEPFRLSRKTKYKNRGFASNDPRGVHTHASFQCAHCKNHIPTLFLLSGVQNRNHCPYCLWSRHMDLHRPGDRLAACRAPMRPIGLAFKHTHKKYGPANQGEVMLIHRCTDCGKLSINRIAADDDTQGLLELFDTLNVIDVEIRMELRLQEIEPLSRDQFDRLRASLCGAVFSAD